MCVQMNSFSFWQLQGRCKGADRYSCGKLIETFSRCMIIITINQDKTLLCADSVASTVPNINLDAVFI